MPNTALALLDTVTEPAIAVEGRGVQASLTPGFVDVRHRAILRT
jgi:hypothetical protein